MLRKNYFLTMFLFLHTAWVQGQDWKDDYAIKHRWPIEKAQQWWNAQEWPVGANFVPSTAVNQIEMWQEFTFDPETIDRELRWASEIGFNTMRVFLHYLVWVQSPQGLKDRIEQYLQIADSHGIKTIFVLFDDVWGDNPTLGEQPKPIPGIHNSGWVECPGDKQRLDRALWPVLEAYTRDIIGTFKNDDRVLMWDVYNEPGNGKNPPSSTLPLLRLVMNAAREVNPSQPLTVGLWNFDREYNELNDYQLAVSDIVSFHTYRTIDETRHIVEQLRKKTNSRPLIVTEYLARTLGNTFQNHLPYFHRENIGAINWGLVSGKTQTIYPWEYPKGTDDSYFNEWRVVVRSIYPWEKRVAPEPKVWFHDIFRADGTPYDSSEIALIKQLSSIPSGQN